MQTCSEEGCTTLAAFTTRTKPAWCDNQITKTPNPGPRSTPRVAGEFRQARYTTARLAQHEHAPGRNP